MHRGVHLFSDALPFGRLWYGDPDAASNAIDYAKFYSRSYQTVIHVCLGHVAPFIKHADDRPVRERARAVLRVRDRAADCVGSCIPDWAASQPIADQIKAVSVVAGTDLVNVLSGWRAFPSGCLRPPKACLTASSNPRRFCSVRIASTGKCNGTAT